jgi:hypothetical protein
MTSKPRRDFLLWARDASIALVPLPTFKRPTVKKQHVAIVLWVLGDHAPTDVTIRKAPIVMATGGSRCIVISYASAYALARRAFAVNRT